MHACSGKKNNFKIQRIYSLIVTVKLTFNKTEKFKHEHHE